MTRTVIYLHRLHFPSESGQTIQVLRDYHSLASLGHAVHLIYTAPAPVSPQNMPEVLAAYGLKEIQTLHLHFLAGGKFGKRRLREVAMKIAITSQLPVVFVTRTLDHARIALDLRQPTGAKVIIELHETAIPHMIFREQSRIFRTLWSRLAEKKIFAAVDGIVCTVGSQKVLLDRLIPVHAKTATLPNGVPNHLLDQITLYDENINNNTAIRLGYAGQLNAWKNVGVMIEALKYLPYDVTLSIAGGKSSSENTTRIALRELAEFHGVGDRLDYLGWLPPNEVPEFLARMDVLLLPLGNNVQSRYFTSPMKLFEYAASGIPMVVTRQPTTTSLIGDSETLALMAEPDSAQDMAMSVARILSDPEMAGRVASNARKWVKQYSYDNRARRLSNFFESLT